MDVALSAVAGWWEWTLSAFFVMDRIWLAAGVAASVVMAMLIARAMGGAGPVWETIVFLILAAGLFALFLDLSHVNPVFFSPEDLARSQVTP